MKIRAHESFSIRKNWLHKGVKNILRENRLFCDKNINACDILGIGSNMVKSMRYWLKAVGIMEEVKEGKLNVQRLTPLGELINENDPFHQEDGTKFILHYKLACNYEDATSWYWFYNEYLGKTVDKKRFVDGLSEYLTKKNHKSSRKVLEDEFNCLVKTYYNKEKEARDPEETKDCPLADLGLLELENSKVREFKKTSPEENDINPLIVYSVICDNVKDKDENNEVLISSLLDDKNNIGKIFNMSRTLIIQILGKLVKMGYIEMSRTAGLDVIKMIRPISLEECLKEYYIELNRG